jgi:hypothetical protein
MEEENIPFKLCEEFDKLNLKILVDTEDMEIEGLDKAIGGGGVNERQLKFFEGT